MFKEFKIFIFRGNVIDLAVGIVIGAAFGSIVTALVSDILTPLISAVAQIPDFNNLSFTLNGSIIKYGHFLNVLISFLLTAAAVFFFIVKPMNILASRNKKEELVAPTTKKCPECLSEIPVEARRCKYCSQSIA